MRLFSLALLAFFLAALAGVSHRRVRPPPLIEPPGALPPGALLRLGATYFRHDGAVHAVCYSPDGTRLASASADQTVQIWEAATGRRLLTLRGHTGSVTRVEYSPDGKTLASAGEDGQARIWDAERGTLLHAIKLHSRPVSVHFSPDGRGLATATNVQVRVWNLDGGQEVLALRHDETILRDFRFSPDGRKVATGAQDGARIWDAVTGRRLLSIPYKRGVASVCFSPDGSRLACLGQDGLVSLRDASSGTLKEQFEEHASGDRFLCYSPDGRHLASPSGERTVRLWDAATGELLRTLTGARANVTAVCFSPDGRRLAASSEDCLICQWEVASGKPLAAGPHGHTAEVRAIRFSPDGRQVATGSADGIVRVWHVAAGRPLLTLEGRSEVSQLRYSPDGTRLAAGVGVVLVWDAWSGLLLERLWRNFGQITSLFYSPDGRWLTATGSNGLLTCWDGAEQPFRESSILPHGPACDSPDGRLLAVVSASPKARLVDPGTGETLRTLLDTPKSSPSSLHFSPDGRRVAGGDFDGTVRVWEVKNGRLTRALERPPGARLEGDRNTVYEVVYSPDGHWLAAAFEDGAVHVWEAATARFLLELRGAGRSVRCLDFSPDGRLLVAGDVATTALVWDATWPTLGPPADLRRGALWDDLAAADPARAHQAVRALARRPTDSLPSLAERARPAEPPTSGRVEELVRELDSDIFARREAGSAALTGMGEPVRPLLQGRLDAGGLSAEQVQRCRRIFDRLERGEPDLRSLRLVRTLELAGTPDAVALLRRLATGAEGATLTGAAGSALARLAVVGRGR